MRRMSQGTALPEAALSKAAADLPSIADHTAGGRA
jgi:hypothetical protein